MEQHQIIKEKIDKNWFELLKLPEILDFDEKILILEDNLSKTNKVFDYIISSPYISSKNDEKIKNDLNYLTKAYLSIQNDIKIFHLQDMRDLEIFLEFLKFNCKIDENLATQLSIILNNIKTQGMLSTNQMLEISKKIREIFVNIIERSENRLKIKKIDEESSNKNLSQNIASFIKEFMKKGFREMEIYFENLLEFSKDR